MSLAFDRNTYGKLLAEYQPQVITSEDEYERMLANAERSEVIPALAMSRSFAECFVTLGYTHNDIPRRTSPLLRYPFLVKATVYTQIRRGLKTPV